MELPVPAERLLAAPGTERAQDLLADIMTTIEPGSTLLVCDAQAGLRICAGALAGTDARFLPGFSWSDRAVVPNALTEALALREPARDGWLSAAPIMAGEQLLGAVAIVTPGHSNGQNLALAAATARCLALQAEWEGGKEEALVHSRTLQELVETISDGFMAINREGRVEYVNRNGAEILGLEVQQVIGQRLSDLVDFQPKVLSVLETGKGWVDREFFIRVGKKGPIHLIKSAIPITTPSGEVTGVIDTFREIRKVRKLVTDMVGARASFTFDEIISRSEEMRQVLRMARQVAAADSTALLQGESGTGKELFAQAIHNASSRAAGPFITIDCAAIPRELVESELFGYVEGAFTGARKGGRPGKFELAHGGTVFLDEIGEMPLELQTKLLRVLQSRMVVRVGGSDAIPVDIRVIAATNRNLADEVRHRNFRQDLFFRLNVVPVVIPPLRKRIDDAELLVDHFLRLGRERHGKPGVEVSLEALALIRQYDWPGNVRELENVVERALTLVEGRRIEPRHLPVSIQAQAGGLASERSELCLAPRLGQPETAILNREEWERSALVEALRRSGDNIVQAARMLHMARSTFYNKLKVYGLR